MFKNWTSQDFHQLMFEFLQHVHGNTGSRSWTGMDFVLELPSTSDSDETLTGDGQLFQARLDGFSTLFSGTHTELGWPWWPQPRVMRTFLVWDHLSGGLQMLKHCFHKSKEKNKRNRDSLKAQSSRFWVQIHHMQLMASVVSVVLFCKLLIASPFVHFCYPDRILPSYFSILMHQNIALTEFSTTSLSQGSWYCYSTTIYTTQLVLSALDEWMSVYSVWKIKYGVVSRFLMNKRKSTFCVPNITTSHIKKLHLFKNEKYGTSVCVMYF